MSKPTGATVAARAVAAVVEGHAYAEMDCQAFIEHCVTACGGQMAFAGSNDMARNAVTGLWPLAEAQRLGKVVKGAGLFINAGAGSEPAKYRSDGQGDFNHVGFYVGENALSDTDKNGKSRDCNVVHSSATMGRVAGSTLKNGWTHVGWFKAIDYGEAAGVVDDGDEKDTGDTAAAVPTAQPSATIVADFYTVKRGCKGGAVRRLQTWLTEIGYGVGSHGVDGDFGAATDAAVRAFQRVQKLTVDGIVGQWTWAALAEVRATTMAAKTE